ncbi:MAG: glycosyl transferase, partial [Pseudolysinimonas sp.]
IAWLLPTALILAVVGFVVARRAPRTSVRRATLALFAGWMLVTGLAFSFMAGIFHSYYTVALAPAIAGVVAIGAGQLWARRASAAWRAVAAGVIVVAGVTAYLLLRLVSGWMPWLQLVVPVLTAVAAVLLLMPPRGRRLTVITATAAAGALLLAPAAYSLQTLATPHTGSIVTAGPGVSGFTAALASSHGGPSVGAPGGGVPGGGVVGRQGGPGGQGPNPLNGRPAGKRAGFANGGLLDAAIVDDAAVAVLTTDAADYTWVAATVGSQRAAGFQLATQLPVMPIGGFNGSDPSPTLAQFQQLVADGRIHYFIAGSVGRSNGGSSASSQIAAWVESRYEPQQIGTVALYDLTS